MNYEAISVWSQGISALLFLALLIFMWFKYIQPAVITAQENANARIAEAERRRDEAKASLESLKHAIDAAKHDADAIKTRAAAQAEFESQSAIAEARDAGERAVRNAEAELARARAAARVKYRDELLESALNLARERASQRVDDRTNSALIASFLASIERGGRN